MIHKVRFHMVIKMFGGLHQPVKSKPYKYHSCTCRYLNSLFHDAARIKSHIKVSSDHYTLTTIAKLNETHTAVMLHMHVCMCVSMLYTCN